MPIFKYLAMTFVGAAVVLTSSFALASPNQVVKASQFQLVGPDGKVHAVLGLSKDNDPKLIMKDRNGKTRMEIELWHGDPEISLNDRDGKTSRVSLSDYARQGPSIDVCDRHGFPVLDLTINEQSEPRLGVGGIATGSMTLGTSDGKPYIMFVGPDGHTAWEPETKGR